MMKNNNLIILLFSVITLLSCQAQSDERPNISWLMAEDISLDLECYGMPAFHVMRQLKKEGKLNKDQLTFLPTANPKKNFTTFKTTLTNLITWPKYQNKPKC